MFETVVMVLAFNQSINQSINIRLFM